MSVSVGYYSAQQGNDEPRFGLLVINYTQQTIRLQGILIDINLRYKKWTRGPWLSEFVRSAHTN